MYKNTKAEILECSTGEGIFKVEQFVDDGFCTLSYFVDRFYLQDPWIKMIAKRVALAFSILMGYEFRLFDITVNNNDDLNRFKYFISQLRDIRDDDQHSETP